MRWSVKAFIGDCLLLYDRTIEAIHINSNGCCHRWSYYRHKIYLNISRDKIIVGDDYEV